MKRFVFLLIGISFTALLGCGPVRYLSKMGWHQARITFSSLPVEDVVQEDRTDPKIRNRIRFIQEVKAYGEEVLGLKKTKNYSTYVETRGPVLYVVTASEPHELRLLHWTYPIIGKVTYKGFFKRGDALEEKRKLEERGYDTDFQPVEAYSTLGWFRDPIFTPMLRWDEGPLANLILHELTHATLYFKGRTDFNEQTATFVGNQGAIEFLKKKYGPGSMEVTRAIESQEDDLLFSGWIEQAFQRLTAYYGQNISKEEKKKGREEIFRSLQEDYGRLKYRFKRGGHPSLDQIPLNNAVILSCRQYYHRLETFEKVYDHLGGDLKEVIALLNSFRISGRDPSLALEQWMKEKGLTVPASLR